MAVVVGVVVAVLAVLVVVVVVVVQLTAWHLQSRLCSKRACILSTQRALSSRYVSPV
jgi:hypothetical protein